jgi:hypothetical protein
LPSDKGKKENAGLSALLEGLINAEIEFILVGGLAAVVQEAPITTMDVDIVHRQTAENIDKLLNFLKSNHFLPSTLSQGRGHKIAIYSEHTNYTYTDVQSYTLTPHIRSQETYFSNKIEAFWPPNPKLLFIAFWMVLSIALLGT